jgi:hypothetical protein
LNIQRLEKPITLKDHQQVKVTEMGNITEISFAEKRSKGGYITKLNDDYYMDNRTGEVKEVQHIQNRAQDLDNVRKSFKALRDLINANVTDVSACRWVTLTYAENMQDPKKLRFDNENCIKRLRKIFGHFEYITIAEPQGRGAWHLHCIYIFNGKAPYMANDVVASCWKKGFVTVKRLDDVDNVGAYLTAYLCDVELPEGDCTAGDYKEVDVKDEHGNITKKRYLKGGRLHLYPPKFNIYRKSKGIVDPQVSFMSYEMAKEKVSSAKLTFSQTLCLEDDEANFKNTLHCEFYNSIRK